MPIDLEKCRFFLNMFGIKGTIVQYQCTKNGRINDTVVIVVKTDEGEYKKYTLQKINTNVFKNPVELMENVANVTNHISNKGKVALHVNRVKDPKKSEYLYFDEATREYWRIYDFLEADVKNQVESWEDMYFLGEAIGDFSLALNDFDATKLSETIKDFHNTASRFTHFTETRVKDLVSGSEVRSKTCEEEINFIVKRGERAALIVDALKLGHIPYRVSHNDTKLNNVLFDKKTHEPMCLIDLDTVMPGTVLYDFGDAARYGCNTEDEEATSTENVRFNFKYFEALTTGFLRAMKGAITKEEVALLVDSVWMMTYELAIRFLDDHIDGNHYFGVPYDGKNLERARVQIALLIDIEENYEALKEIVKEAIRDAE